MPGEQVPIQPARAARVRVHSTPINLDPFRAAKQEYSRRYLHSSEVPAMRALAATSPAPERNVVGVGIGEKVVAGKPTGQLAVKFFVRIKYPDNQIPPNDILPTAIHGLPTDVEQTGPFRRFTRKSDIVAPADTMPENAETNDNINPRTRIRPAQPGCSIGFQEPNGNFAMAGTFGALVQDSNNAQYILSNNHVLADEDQLQGGAPIFQPGLLDGGNPATDQIARLTVAIPLSKANTNRVDCAIAQVLELSLVSNTILEVGPPQGTTQGQIDMAVEKFGRTTNYTVGQIISTDTDVTVQYETGNYVFEGNTFAKILGGS